MIARNIEAVCRSLAIDTIASALLDLGQPRLKYSKNNLSKNVHIVLNRREALAWFNERSSEPFGYGWCLECSHLSPNLVRKRITQITRKVK